MFSWQVSQKAHFHCAAPRNHAARVLAGMAAPRLHLLLTLLACIDCGSNVAVPTLQGDYPLALQKCISNPLERLPRPQTTISASSARLPPPASPSSVAVCTPYEHCRRYHDWIDGHTDGCFICVHNQKLTHLSGASDRAAQLLTAAPTLSKNLRRCGMPQVQVQKRSDDVRAPFSVTSLPFKDSLLCLSALPAFSHAVWHPRVDCQDATKESY